MLNNKLKIPIEKLYPLLVFNYVTENLPTKNTYEDRLLWQKIGYLAQQFGASLNDFNFTWYKAGPYSPAYTSILYSLPLDLDDMYDYGLDDKVVKKLSPLKMLYNNVPTSISTVKWFELIASILYIVKETDSDKTSVMKTLIRRKPFFNNNEVNNHAWSFLKELNMV